MDLTDDQDINEDGEPQGKAARIRFKGIVESGGRDAASPDDEGISFFRHDEQRLNAKSRQIWLAARLTAAFVFCLVFIGLPLGNWIAHQQLNAITGVDRPWNPLQAYGVETLMFAFIIPSLVLFIGYAGSRFYEIIRAAESVADAAQRFMTPDINAAKNVDAVGAVVQAHVSALNEGLDTALTRLASVEAMIRQHVEAIELAGDAIETKATGAVGRVADERSRLMDLTESLNAHADSFAAAIAEKARTTIASLESAESLSVQAEKDFEDRLVRLEGAAQRAFDGFESLRDALRDVDESMRASAQSIDQSAAETRKATERANAAADAAAESAARNAANIGASANRAAEEAKRAADDAIASAKDHAERGTKTAIEHADQASQTAIEHAEKTAKAAIDVASDESLKVQEAASRALEDISRTTSGAVAAAQEGAAMATKAAEEVSEAARRTGEAADKASTEVAAASERARKSADEALKFTESEASRIEERNKALAEARAALEEENARLEGLIEEQRKRADRLAEAIASQTDRLSRLAEAQLREQEAAARLAEAQNEMQARADRQAAEKKKAEETERKTREAEAAKKAEEAARAREEQATLELDAKAKKKKAPEPKPEEKQEKPAAKNGAGAARLDELARDIAQRRPKGGAKEAAKDNSGKRKKSDVSWREILDAADDGAPLDLGAVSRKEEPAKEEPADDAENAIRIIARLQDFTHEMETRLYGDPPPALQERFERGDRNVFANRLLRLNEADVKRRIRTESGRDRKFEAGVHNFLQGFEQLLEDATTSETADEELEEYLSSPLGRVYLLIGATVGYFA